MVGYMKFTRMKFSIAGGDPRYKSLQYSVLLFISSTAVAEAVPKTPTDIVSTMSGGVTPGRQYARAGNVVFWEALQVAGISTVTTGGTAVLMVVIGVQNVTLSELGGLQLGFPRLSVEQIGVQPDCLYKS